MSSPSTRITSIRAATCTPNEYSQFPSLPGTCILVFETGSVQISRVCNRVLQKSGGLTAASRQRQFDLGSSVWSSSDLAQVPHVRARRRRRSTFLGPGAAVLSFWTPLCFSPTDAKALGAALAGAQDLKPRTNSTKEPSKSHPPACFQRTTLAFASPRAVVDRID